MCSVNIDAKLVPYELGIDQKSPQYVRTMGKKGGLSRQKKRSQQWLLRHQRQQQIQQQPHQRTQKRKEPSFPFLSPAGTKRRAMPSRSSSTNNLIEFFFQ